MTHRGNKPREQRGLTRVSRLDTGDNPAHLPHRIQSQRDSWVLSLKCNLYTVNAGTKERHGIKQEPEGFGQNPYSVEKRIKVSRHKCNSDC